MPRLRSLSLVLLMVLASSAAVRAANLDQSRPTAAPPAAQRWPAGVQSDLARLEYEVTWQADAAAGGMAPAWQAPNRAHGFRTHFVPEGIRVVPRTEDQASWVWGLSLVAYGRGGVAWGVEPASLAPSGARVEYERGEVREWYLNDSRGLKQSFELRAAPGKTERLGGREPLPGRVALPGRGRPVDGEALLHLDLALTGDLMPIVASDGQSIDFALPGGERVVRYAGLVVSDAGGRELPAWMEGVADDVVRGIRIVIDDRDASYPITVDPLATSPVWAAEGGQVSADFGWAAETAGDVNGDGYSDLIVGAYRYDNGQSDEGRAFLYLGSPSSLYTTPSWTAESDQAGALFGNSVATAGDVNGDGYSDVVVGAENFSNGQNLEGRTFLYLGSAFGLAATPAWTAEGNQLAAQFGTDVGTAGDVNGDGYSDVIVGAAPYDSGQADVGAAFVFLGSGSGLAASPAWTVVGDQAGCQFGLAVATAGDVNSDGYADVIIGAQLYSNGEAFEGRAFVYLGSAGGLPTTPSWTAESNQVNAQLGYSVATAGDVNGDAFADVIISIDSYDNGQVNEGRAVVYHGSPGGLGSTAAWTVESDQVGAQFGTSVATAGDVNGDGYSDVVVGAYALDSAGMTDVGGAFAYFGSIFGLSATPSWQVFGPQQFDWFGIPVGTAGDVNGDGYSDVFVGASLLDGPIHTDAGAVFVYSGSAGGPETANFNAVLGGQASANLGWSIAPAGDVNGDGWSDVIVGAPAYDNGQADEGRAFLYPGSWTIGHANGFAWSAEGNQAGAAFGFSVASAGDVNGDGYGDVIIGAYAFDNGQSDEGRSFVYLGSPTGLKPTPAWTAESNQASAWFGNAVASAGDVNGDGYSDVVVGAENFDNGQTDEGRVFVYLGSAGGLGLTPAWTAENNRTGSRLGLAAASAGDVNGDGYSDLIVGAPYLDTFSEIAAGEAALYLGSVAGLDLLPAWSVQGSTSNYNMGFSVASAGDVNGDGYSDVIVGEPGFEALFQPRAGRARVYLGSSGGLSALDSWAGNGGQAFAFFGWSVASAGDVNGDGFSDVIVGAPYYDGGQTDEGIARLFLGSASGLGLSPAWSVESDRAFTNLGFSVASAGDANGDGYADVLAGAPYYTQSLASEGRVFVGYGNGVFGGVLQPQQRRADNAAPIATGLHARTPGSFRLSALGRSPAGRGGVKLEWSVKPQGEFFGVTGQRGAAWFDSSTGWAILNELQTGLEPAGYHWRARVLYRPTQSPFLPASRWFSMPLNGAQETDVTLSAFIGGSVWEDVDGDGIRDSGEPPLVHLPVHLQDASGATTGSTFTDAQGNYRFEILDAAAHRILFTPPAGYQFTLQDQGVDDSLDSDADPFSGQTGILGPPFQAVDGTSWSAGMLRIGPCVPPDEPIYIYSVRLSADGNGYPILDFQDPNQALQRTGYNIRRSSNAALPKTSWPLLATNVTDMDAATPNLQWVDTSGAISPSGIWYFEVTAWNAACGAEGPF